MVEDKTIHWIRLFEIKQYYLASLDLSIEIKAYFGEEALIGYKPQQPTLQGLINYCKNYNVSGWKSVIIGKNNKLLKITNGK